MLIHELEQSATDFSYTSLIHLAPEIPSILAIEVTFYNITRD